MTIPFSYQSFQKLRKEDQSKELEPETEIEPDESDALSNAKDENDEKL